MSFVVNVFFTPGQNFEERHVMQYVYVYSVR